MQRTRNRRRDPERIDPIVRPDVKLAEDIFFHFSQTLAVALAIGLLAAVELQLVAAQLAALSETESPRLFLFAGGHSEWAELMPKD